MYQEPGDSTIHRRMDPMDQQLLDEYKYKKSCIKCITLGAIVFSIIMIFIDLILIVLSIYVLNNDE